METATPANPFLEDDDDIAAEVRAAPDIPPIQDRLGYDDISRQMILDGFILTALELHTELQEIGKPVSYLKDYFSNPGNFERTKHSDVQSTSPPVGLQRSGSIQTFDSLDWARYSDDGDRQAEDRVAGLEFELRKAQDTIKSLRKALTIATENSTNSEVSSEQKNSANASSESTAETIKPHQRRAINFLVNEYLLLHDYKLTSITFADENENQDFEHWDDVGLNISKPPDLLHLYLDFGKHVAPTVDTCEVSTCDNFYKQEMEALDKRLRLVREQIDLREEDLTSLNLANESLTTDIQILKLENCTLLDKLEEQKLATPVIDSSASSVENQRTKMDTVDGTESISQSTRQLYSYVPVDREIPRPFLHHILSLSYHIPDDNRIAQQVSQIDGNNTHTIIKMIAQSLPHIVPNVLLAKREELLPLILCAANLHQSTKARDSMLNTLFNLIKKPDELQRQMILTGCIMFAQYNGPERVEVELLPQCWEQINDKYTERRLLVVNACCALIPYMSASIRASLVLSMLQQMLLDEKVQEIRVAVVRSLGILVCFIDDKDKFPQILNLYGRHILPDTALAVQDQAVKVLLPSLALWAVHIDRVSDITELLFASLQNSLTEPNEENEIRVIPDTFLPVMKHLHKLINFQYISLLYSGPYKDESDVSVTDDRPTANYDTADLDHLFTLVPNMAQYRQLWTKLTEYTSEEWYKTWEQFDLLVYTVFTRLSMLALSIQTDDYKVVKSVVCYVHSVCTVLGQRITADKIEPKFNELFKYEDMITSQHHKVYTSALLPMLVCGVKAAFHEPSNIADLISCLHKFIISMAESDVPTQSLEMALAILLDDSKLVEPILDSLLELIKKGATFVRISCSHLLEICSRCANCTIMIHSKIVPGLVTLVSDSDSTVKMSTISSFGSLLEVSSNREVTDRVYSEFISLIQHVEKTGDMSMLMSMVTTFSRIGPNIEPQFREEVVLNQLCKWSRENNHYGDTIKRRDVALALIDAYCALSCCFVSNRVLRESFLPGLKALQLDFKELVLEGGAVIQSMIRDMESKLGEDNSSGVRFGAQASTPHATAMNAQPSDVPVSPRGGKSVFNKFMEKSAPNKMTSLFSKRK